MKCPACGKTTPLVTTARPPLPARKTADASTDSGSSSSSDDAPTESQGLPGIAAPADLRTSAINLAIAMIGVAAIGILPAVYISYLAWAGDSQQAAIPTWALLTYLVAILHLAYAIYLVQLPDWSTVWVTTAITLMTSAAYATLLGLRLLVSDQHRLIHFLQLDINRFHAGQEAGWCFIMLMLTGVVSYFAGRSALHWGEVYQRDFATAEP